MIIESCVGQYAIVADLLNCAVQSNLKNSYAATRMASRKVAPNARRRGRWVDAERGRQFADTAATILCRVIGND